MNRFVAVACAAAMLSAIAAPLHATIIVDNSFDPADIMDGANINQGSPSIWDDFSATGPVSVAFAQTWGAHWEDGVAPAVVDFVVEIRVKDGAGALGAPVGSAATTVQGVTDTGFNHNNSPAGDILRYDLSLDAPILLAGAGEYYVSIYLGTPGSQIGWAWQRLNQLTGSPIGNANQDAAYTLSSAEASAVPVPAALPLLLTGLAGLGLIRRRA